MERVVGTNPPFRHPVFVLTHHARDPLELEGGTTFTFITRGIDEALELVRMATPKVTHLKFTRK